MARVTGSGAISTHALVQRAAESKILNPRLPPISTHALVQRAASWCMQRDGTKFISTHALVQRAAGWRSPPVNPANFNPRPRAEGGGRIRRA